MKKLVALAVAAAFVGSFAVAAFASGEAYKVPKATIKVDGKVDDWAGIPKLHIEGEAYVGDAAAVDGNSFDFATAYAGDLFYLYIDAVAPVVSFWQDLGSVWNQTGAEIFFAGAQLGMGIDPDGNPGFAFKEGGKDIKVWKTPKGWALEASYSFSALNENYSDLIGCDFKPGSSFPFSVGVDITDTEGGTRTGQLYYPVDWTWNAPDTFAIATLEK